MWESVRYAALLPYRRPTRASLRSRRRRQVRRSQMLLSNPLLAKCPEHRGIESQASLVVCYAHYSMPCSSGESK